MRAAGLLRAWIELDLIARIPTRRAAP
jgi:hypothetical protein